jgi:hypothetical protein
MFSYKNLCKSVSNPFNPCPKNAEFSQYRNCYTKKKKSKKALRKQPFFIGQLRLRGNICV